MARPISTINALVGDASFVARHDRLPTPADDQTERIATHLAFAEQILGTADHSRFTSAQSAARAELLAVLRAYIAARRFPLPEATSGRLPAFIDREGTRCAVAALVDHAVGAAACERINARFHDAFVADIESELFAILAVDAGLTRTELALIQPTYAYMPPQPPAIVWQADATAAAALASGASDHPVLGLIGFGARWEGRHNEYIGDSIVALDAHVGADSGRRVAYAAEARIGTEMLWFAGEMIGNCSPCSGHRTGILAGVRLDADGSRVPRAWTIPVDAYWYVPWGHEHLHIGAVGGARVRFAGADRALGWTAGLDVVLAHKLQYGDRPTRPTDWHVEVGVERVADLTLVALTVGTASAGRYNAGPRDW